MAKRRFTKKDMIQAARQLGKHFGRLGGKAAARRMTAAQRAERARKAAKTRWGRKKT